MTRAIVVGSGMAGLTVGAYLARDGVQVDVFEQAGHIGGVTTTFRRDGFSWDIGPLMIEGFAPGEPSGRVLAELGCADQVELVRADRGIVFQDYHLQPPQEYIGPYWRRERLKEIFPDQADGLDRYYQFYDTMLDLMTLMRRAEDAGFLRSLPIKLRMARLFGRVKHMQEWSSQRAMDHFFTDDRLKALFLGILADLVVRPSDFAALAVPAMNQETAFDRRLPATAVSVGPRTTFQYVRGGCQSLVDAVTGVLASHRGRLHTSSTVTRVIVEHGRARGIELADGTRHEADIVLVTGGARECFEKLVGRDILPRETTEHLDDLRLMESVFMVHVGVDMDVSRHQSGVLDYHYWTYDLEGAIRRIQDGEYHGGRDGFLIYIPSFHSPEMAPPGLHAVTIYTVAPNKLAGSWEERRQEMTDKLLDCAEEAIPGLREHARVVVSMTPDDFKKRTHLDHHAFGGVSPVMGKSGMPHKTPIDGLWFLGSQSETAGGVNNVTLGARAVYHKVRASR
jgi:phytoene dehydrogenase-like protein